MTKKAALRRTTTLTLRGVVIRSFMMLSMVMRLCRKRIVVRRLVIGMKRVTPMVLPMRVFLVMSPAGPGIESMHLRRSFPV
jgi:hypothetical protein